VKSEVKMLRGDSRVGVCEEAPSWRNAQFLGQNVASAWVQNPEIALRDRFEVTFPSSNNIKSDFKPNPMAPMAIKLNRLVFVSVRVQHIDKCLSESRRDGSHDNHRTDIHQKTQGVTLPRQRTSALHSPGRTSVAHSPDHTITVGMVCGNSNESMHRDEFCRLYIG
jgi:hypothetical protein